LFMVLLKAENASAAAEAKKQALQAQEEGR
jgi:hypothetical protein